LGIVQSNAAHDFTRNATFLYSRQVTVAVRRTSPAWRTPPQAFGTAAPEGPSSIRTRTPS
jgi:hypothetical protein